MSIVSRAVSRAEQQQPQQDVGFRGYVATIDLTDMFGTYQAYVRNRDRKLYSFEHQITVSEIAVSVPAVGRSKNVILDDNDIGGATFLLRPGSSRWLTRSIVEAGYMHDGDDEHWGYEDIQVETEKYKVFGRGILTLTPSENTPLQLGLTSNALDIVITPETIDGVGAPRHTIYSSRTIDGINVPSHTV